MVDFTEIEVVDLSLGVNHIYKFLSWFSEKKAESANLVIC